MAPSLSNPSNPSARLLHAQSQLLGRRCQSNLEYRYITDTAVAFEAYKNNEFDIVPLALKTWRPSRQMPP